MDRREFVALAGAGSALGLSGTAAVAGGSLQPVRSPSFDAITQKVDRIRSQMREAGRRFRIRCEDAPRIQELGEGDDSRTASVARCFRGMYGYGILRTVPVEQQAHPAMQGLLEEVCHDVGDGISEVVDLFAGLTPEAQSALDEIAVDLESSIGMMDLLEAEMGILDLPSEARDRTAGVFRQLRWNIKQKRFSAEVERLSQKVRRLQRKAERIARSGDLALLGVPAGDSAARFLNGSQQWAVDGNAGNAGNKMPLNKKLGKRQKQPIAGVATVVLGALVLGVGVLAGGMCVAAGVSIIWCFCVGIPLIIAGIGIFAAGVAYGPLVVRRGLRMGQQRRPRTPVSYRSLEKLTVHPKGDWLDTGIDLAPDSRYYLSAEGTVKLSYGWRTSPLGSSRTMASKGAFVKKAPEGALVGSVGGQTIVLSDRFVFPKGLEGRLLLGVNISDEHRSRRFKKGKSGYMPGRFWVRLFQL